MKLIKYGVLALTAIHCMAQYTPKSTSQKEVRGSAELVSEVSAGNLPRIMELLKAGADPNSTDAGGFSALNSAITHNLGEVVELLVAKGADVNFGYMGSSPLALARDSMPAGESEKIMALLKKHGGVYSDFDLAQAELRVRFGRSGKSLEDNYIAAIKSGDQQVLAIFLRYFYDINKPISNGLTPLHIAAFYGSPETIQFLVGHGADVNARSPKGTPVLYLAKDHPENLAKLKELGAIQTW